MAQGSSRLKIGLFVTVSFCILAGVILWLAGFELFRPMNRYQVVFDRSVIGLLPGADVQFRGVTVGRVEKLRLSHDLPPRPVAIIAVSRGTPIRTNTTASLYTLLITNISSIELQGGTADHPPLPRMGIIPVTQRPLEQIEDRATVISEKLLSTLDAVQKDLLTRQNMADVSRAVANLAALSANLRTTFDDLSTPRTRASVKLMIAELAHTAAGMARLTSSLDSLRPQAQQALASMADLVNRLDRLVASNQSEVGRLLTNLDATSQQLREVAALIRRDPSQLIWGSDLPARRIPDK